MRIINLSGTSLRHLSRHLRRLVVHCTSEVVPPELPSFLAEVATHCTDLTVLELTCEAEHRPWMYLASLTHIGRLTELRRLVLDFKYVRHDLGELGDLGDERLEEEEENDADHVRRVRQMYPRGLAALANCRKLESFTMEAPREMPIGPGDDAFMVPATTTTTTTTNNNNNNNNNNTTTTPLPVLVAPLAQCRAITDLHVDPIYLCDIPDWGQAFPKLQCLSIDLLESMAAQRDRQSGRHTYGYARRVAAHLASLRSAACLTEMYLQCSVSQHILPALIHLRRLKKLHVTLVAPVVSSDPPPAPPPPPPPPPHEHRHHLLLLLVLLLVVLLHGSRR